MNAIQESVALMEELCKQPEITRDDVMAIRRATYGDGICSFEEAEAIFALDLACPVKDPEWGLFYVDSLTDFFVWQAEPRGYVSEEQAAFLMERISCDGRIDQLTELELLINILHRAESCPEPLVLMVLQAVRESILSPATAIYGSNRPPALITTADAAIIRKVIYAPSGDGSLTVTRCEAEMIFDLNDAVRGEDNTAEWQDLFVKAIANHLMFPRPAPEVPDARTVLNREAWLAERRGVGRLLAGMTQAFARRDVPFSEAWRDIDPLGSKRAAEEREEEDRRTREAMQREAIDPVEAKWLIDRIGRDGVLDDNERALLAFIRDNATSIDPALEPLLARAAAA